MDPTPVGSPLSPGAGGLSPVVFRPKGPVLAAGSADSNIATIVLWDTSRPDAPARLGEPLRGHTSTVTSLAFTADGKTLASGSGDGTIRLWDLSRPVPQTAQILVVRQSDLEALAVNAAGILAGGYIGLGGAIQLWDIADPRHVTAVDQPLTAHTSTVTSVAFSLDGRVLAGGSADKSIALWELS